MSRFIAVDQDTTCLLQLFVSVHVRLAMPWLTYFCISRSNENADTKLFGQHGELFWEKRKLMTTNLAYSF